MISWRPNNRHSRESGNDENGAGAPISYDRGPCAHCTRTDSFTPRGSDDLLRSLSHVVGADDRQSRLGEYLAAQLLVGAFHANDQRHFELDFACGGDDASSDGVALHDAAENVDEDRP